jgi:hypothetical protein
MATKYPPALNVSEAIAVIEKMFNKHSGNEVAVDLMPEILGVTSGSSYFPSKISALQKYGLTKKTSSDMLIMTDLAMEIVAPIGENEKTNAIISLFENTEVLSDFYKKYGKTNLPSPEQVKSSLNKEYGIEREYVNKWYFFIVDSFKAIRIPVVPPLSLTLLSNAVPATQTPLEIKKADLFRIPLMGSKVFEFSMPEELNNEDLDFIISFFELRKKNVKK